MMADHTDEPPQKRSKILQANNVSVFGEDQPDEVITTVSNWPAALYGGGSGPGLLVVGQNNTNDQNAGGLQRNGSGAEASVNQVGAGGNPLQPGMNIAMQSGTSGATDIVNVANQQIGAGAGGGTHFAWGPGPPQMQNFSMIGGMTCSPPMLCPANQFPMARKWPSVGGCPQMPTPNIQISGMNNMFGGGMVVGPNGPSNTVANAGNYGAPAGSQSGWDINGNIPQEGISAHQIAQRSGVQMFMGVGGVSNDGTPYGLVGGVGGGPPQQQQQQNSQDGVMEAAKGCRGGPQQK